MPPDTRPGRATAVPEDIWAPTCMTIAEHHAWLDADAETGFRGGRPCADCPGEWRAERLAEGDLQRAALDAGR